MDILSGRKKKRKAKAKARAKKIKAQTVQTWYSMDHDEDEHTAEIFIYDEIGFWGISAQDFIDDLQAIPKSITNILVRLNTPGGEVFDGFAIYHSLIMHPATIETRVDGLAASMGSIIFQAGDIDKRVMMDGAFLMVHNPWGCMCGDAEDFRKESEFLEKIEERLAIVYKRHCDLTDEECRIMMNDDTWMTADEAVEIGLASDVETGHQIAATVTSDRFNNVPEAALKFIKSEEEREKANASKNKQEAQVAKPKAKATANVSEDAKAKAEELKKAKALVAAAEAESNDEGEGESNDDAESDGEGESNDDAEGNGEGEGSGDDPQPEGRKAEGKQFIDMFGEDQGSKYYAQGLNIDEAKEAHIKAQDIQIKSLRAEGEKKDQKISAVDALGDEGLDDSSGGDDSGNGKDFSGVLSPGLAKFANGLKLAK